MKKSTTVAAIYELLNPVPYGFFIAALMFDIIYVRSAGILWTKSASWLIALGLIFAIIPRLINLYRVWFYFGKPTNSSVKPHFWLNFLAIILAIINAFVHSRDAYAVVPHGLMLSVVVVALIGLANILQALDSSVK
jgi:uncharacterized membrane protein